MPFFRNRQESNWNSILNFQSGIGKQIEDFIMGHRNFIRLAYEASEFLN